MRVRAIAAVLFAGGLAAVAPGSASAGHFKQVRLRASGSIRVVWHGDPARGCASAGLCRYSGSTTYPFRHGGGFLELEPGTSQPFFGILDGREPVVTRTERAEAGGRVAVCSQRSRYSSFTLSTPRAFHGHDWLTLGTDIFPTPLASGQCAGPRSEDFLPSLPSAAMRRGAIKRRGTRISLRGRFAFASGALSGHVISTVRLTSRGVHRLPFRDYDDEEPDRGPKHQLYVELRYRVVRMQGEARNDFRAVAAPICRVRDACGAHGSEVYSLDDADRTLVVRGFAGTRSGRRPSLRRALRRILRHGFVDGFVSIRRRSGLTSTAFVRRDGTTCTDRFRPHGAQALGLFGGHGKFFMELLRGEGALLRGRCPGPTEPVFESDIARARVSRAQLQKHAMTLRLRSRHGFRAGAYRGTRAARLNVRLRRTHARVRVDPHFHRRGVISESFAIIHDDG